MTLPSKKVLSLLILTGAVVASVMLAFGKDKSATAINFASNLVAGEKVSIPENPNWQSEVSKIVSSADPSSTTEPGEAGSVTDTVSTTLISNYLSLKQSGTLDQTSAQKLIDQTVSLVDQLGNQAVLDTKLNVVQDNGKWSIEDYGENLGRVLKNNRPIEIKNEMEIINAAVSERNESKIKELDSIITIYEKVGNDLIKMPVPKTFVKAHLDMANGSLAVALALKEIKNVFSDPIKSLSAIQLYQQGMAMFIGAKQATNTFIMQNQIVYKQGSGGYYLLYGI